MNEQLRLQPAWTTDRVRLDLADGLPWPKTTQAAEGMPRRPWNRTEIEAMVKAGIIDEGERFELIGGEVVPMSPKGARHEMVKGQLNRFLQRLPLDDFWILPETTLWLDNDSYVEPDLLVFPRELDLDAKRGHDMLLAIEIADTSLAYDLGRKIGIYAAYGVPEVWVINANSLVTRLHRSLGAEGYRTIVDQGPEQEITAVRVDTLTMCLAGLGLKPLDAGSS